MVAPTAQSSVSGPSGPATPASAASQDNPSTTSGASTQSTAQPAQATIPLKKSDKKNWPTELDIPSIGVKAKFGQPIVQVWDGKEWTITPPETTWEDLQRAYWWREHALPGPTKDTAYVYAHACDPTQCAFNKLHLVRVGAMVRVVTDTYVAAYRIVPIDPHQPHAGVQQFAKTVKGIGSSTSSVADFHVPGRLVLITCGYTPDGASPFNWVAFAQLVSAHRK